MWWLVLPAAPVILFSYLAYHWEAVKRLYGTVTSKRKALGQTDGEETREKHKFI